MLVTPTGRLRRLQPPVGDSSAMAGNAAPAAASSAAMLSHIPGRIPSLARYIVVVPFSRGPQSPPRDTLTESEPASPVYFGLEASEGDSLMRPIRRCRRSARPRSEERRVG